MKRYRNHTPREVLLSPHYAKHVSAMTGEALHSKGEIAEELAWRDMQIEQLRSQVISVAYVSEVPSIKQGEPSHEVEGVLDAETVKTWLATLEKFRAELGQALEFIREIANSTPADDMDGTPYAAQQYLDTREGTELSESWNDKLLGMKPHIFREMINELRDTAVKYHDHQSLRERLSGVVRDAIRKGGA